MKKQHGFTLVELAISLMVIGLLIGGVLKGQELIGNARSASLLRQIDSYQSATRMFISTYGTLPGDIKSPTRRLPECNTGTPCDAGGNGDNMIWNNSSFGSFGGNMSIANVGAESRAYFLHLAKAGMITGVNTGSNSATFSAFGEEFPAISDGNDNGVIVYYYYNYGWSGGPPPPNNAYIIRATSDNSYALMPRTVLYIEDKIDDKQAAVGNVRAIGAGSWPTGACAADTPPYAYNETTKDRVCNMMVLFDASDMR